MSQLLRAKQTDVDIVSIDGTRPFTGTVGGITPVAASDLATKGYVDGVASSGLAKTDKAVAAAVTSGAGSTTGVAITTTPVGWVGVHINTAGPYELGDGVKTTDCYFSADGGTTAKAIGSIVATDVLYWNGPTVGFELDTSDEISLVYA